MGRHETFKNAAPIADELLAGTILTRGSVGADAVRLADACDWAIQHRAWVDGITSDENWTDADFDRESMRINAVFTRAIEEPSASLRDLSAKARLALEDYERFTATEGDDHDDGVRIVHTVLREASALNALTLAAPMTDPVFAQIKAHRAAYTAWLPHLEATTEARGGSPEWNAAHSAAEGPMQEEQTAFGEIIHARPTTTAGLKALASYLPEAVRLNGCSEPDDDAVLALRTMCNGVLALVSDDTSKSFGWSNPPPGFMASPAIEPFGFTNIEEGIRIELERLRDIAQAEIDRRSADVWEGAHETMRAGLENRLRRRFRLDEIKAALAPEVPVPAGVDVDGLVYYEDAAGQTWRQPVAHWVGFTAQRLYSVARQEHARQFNAACSDLDPAGREELYAKLTRELRIDALQALAFQSDKVFEVEEARRQGIEPPMPTGPRHDFSGLGALTTDILDGWRAWSATLGKPETDAEASAAFERACDRRDELLDAAEALPASPDSLVAKALALAWLGIAEEGRPGLRRSEHSFVGRIAFDVDAVITGAAGSEPSADDAALIALEAEFLAADAAYIAAGDAMREGRGRYVDPPVPTALKVWSNDWIYTSIPMPKARSERFHYDQAEIDILRAQPCVATFIGGKGELQPDGVGRVRPDPRAQARADAIVAAWDQWQAQIREARAALDLDALEAAWDATMTARDAVLQRVRETTAHGLPGLAVKARIATNMAALDDPKAHARAHYDPDDSEGLFYDLAGDVLAATGGLPDAFRLEA